MLVIKGGSVEFPFVTILAHSARVVVSGTILTITFTCPSELSGMTETYGYSATDTTLVLDNLRGTSQPS